MEVEGRTVPTSPRLFIGLAYGAVTSLAILGLCLFSLWAWRIATWAAVVLLTLLLSGCRVNFSYDDLHSMELRDGDPVMKWRLEEL